MDNKATPGYLAELAVTVAIYFLSQLLFTLAVKRLTKKRNILRYTDGL